MLKRMATRLVSDLIGVARVDLLKDAPENLCLARNRNRRHAWPSLLHLGVDLPDGRNVLVHLGALDRGVAEHTSDHLSRRRRRTLLRRQRPPNGQGTPGGPMQAHRASLLRPARNAANKGCLCVSRSNQRATQQRISPRQARTPTWSPNAGPGGVGKPILRKGGKQRGD